MPSHPRSPPLQQISLPTVTLPAPSHAVSQSFYGPTPLLVNLPSQSSSQSEVRNLQKQTYSPLLVYQLFTIRCHT